MYELQLRNSAIPIAWKSSGHRSNSMSDLKDFANLQNTDYRIIDMAGNVVWEFFKVKEKASRKRNDSAEA